MDEFTEVGCKPRLTLSLKQPKQQLQPEKPKKQPKQPPNAKVFWILWCEDTKEVTRKYTDYNAAHAASQKMSGKHPEGIFHIMKRVKTVRVKAAMVESSACETSMPVDAPR